MVFKFVISSQPGKLHTPIENAQKTTALHLPLHSVPNPSPDSNIHPSPAALLSLSHLPPPVLHTALEENMTFFQLGLDALFSCNIYSSISFIP